MKNIYLIAALCLTILSACGNPLGNSASTADDNYHPGAPADPPTTPAVPQPSVGTDTGVKLAPGTLRASGNSTSAKMTITNNDEKLQGTHVSGHFSFSKSVMR